jgi:mannose-6-phosphate isomerase-like protein (cupin superfamily)
MHPTVHGNSSQSLAEATIAPRQQTLLHRHPHTEELYHVRQGTGLMTLGEKQVELSAGDTVAIPANTFHSVLNTGDDLLVLLCACTPAYSHDDTEIAEGQESK